MHEQVALSPLALDEALQHPFHQPQSEHRPHPFSIDAEHIRDISSAARAYLPSSTSFLTTATSHDRLPTLACQRNSEVPSWPSSVMLHNGSSPARGGSSSMLSRVGSIYPSEEIESILELKSDDDGALPYHHQDTTSSQPSRMRSCPALRGAFHAKRQRESMLMMHSGSDVDEFGQLSSRPSGRSSSLAPAVLRSSMSNMDFHKDDDHDRVKNFMPGGRTPPVAPTKPTRGCRDTFGNAIMTPLRAASQRVDRPPTLGLDTPALLGSSPSSCSSLRAARRWECGDVLPSPQSSLFRFPALCLAAVEQASSLSACSSPSLASVRCPRWPVQPSTLGSPIYLSSEQPSIRPARSEFSSSSSEEDDEVCVESAQDRASLAKAQSDTRIFALQQGPRPLRLFESQSMPNVTEQQANVADETVTERAFRAISNVEEPQQREASFAEERQHEHSSHERSFSGASVCAILHSQEVAMHRLRVSERWSPPEHDSNLEQSSGDAEHTSPTSATGPRVSWISIRKDIINTRFACECEHVRPREQAYTGSPAILGEKERFSSHSRTTEGPMELHTRSDLSRAVVERADKSTQTGAPPPRPARNSARLAEQVRKPPGICIMLASPRKSDNENHEIDEQGSVGLGLGNLDDLPELDESLLMPIMQEERRPIDTTLPIALDVGVHQYEIGALLIEMENAPDTKTDPSKPQLVTTLLTAALPNDNACNMRESTTSAAIEAMLEQLRRAQSARNLPPLSTGGRRHARRDEQLD